MKRNNKKKPGQSNFAKLSIFHPQKYKFKRKCPLSGKDAPVVDYKNIKLLSRDFVGYANHYHNNKIKLPYWAKGQKPVKVIGNHIFYKL